jgi:hypothetical protein
VRGNTAEEASMRMSSMRIVTALLLACAIAVAAPDRAAASVSVTYNIGPSQSMLIMAVVPGSSSPSKTPAGLLKVAVTLTPASACQLVLRLDGPGVIVGGGTFIFQVLPSRPGVALVDVSNLLSGSNLSIQNVTLGSCSFTVDLE